MSAVYPAPERLQPPDPYPDGRFLLPLCVTAEETLLLLQVAEQGGLSLGFGRQGAHMFPLWKALSHINEPHAACDEAELPPDSGNGDTNNDEDMREVVRYMCATYPDLIEEELDDMTRPTFQVYDGRLHIGIPCSCGGYDWYPVGAKAQLSPDGVPIRDTDAPTGIQEVNPGTPTNPDGTLTSSGDCYVDRAADIMIKRQVDFVQALYGWSNSGITAFTGGIVFDAYEVVGALLDPGTDINEALNADGLSANDIQQLAEHPDWHSRLEDAIQNRDNYGALTRRDVMAIVIDALGVIPYGVTQYFQAFVHNWSSFCNLKELNQELSIAADACRLGVNLPGDVLPGDAGVHEDASTVFKVYRTGPLTLLHNTPEPTGLSLSAGESIVGYIMNFGTGQPINEGGNENTDIEYSDGKVAEGYYQASAKPRNAEGWLPLDYDNAYQSADFDDVLNYFNISGVNRNAVAFNGGGTAAGEVYIRHHTGASGGSSTESQLSDCILIVATP